MDRRVEDMEVGHALTLVSDDVHEGLPVWSSKPGIDELCGLSLKTIGGRFVGLVLKTRHGWFGDFGLNHWRRICPVWAS